MENNVFHIVQMPKEFPSHSPNIRSRCGCWSMAWYESFRQTIDPIFVFVEKWRFARIYRRYIEVSSITALLKRTRFTQYWFICFCRVCGERELPGEGFSILTRTADTEHKAWRKRQICYRLAKRGAVKQAVTDIILCSKMKTAPDGFALAGEINGVMICFKVGPIAHRPPPSVPNDQQSAINELESNLYYMNIQNASNIKNANGKGDNGNNNDDYEILQTSYRLSPPKRLAPKPPIQSPIGNWNTSEWTH